MLQIENMQVNLEVREIACKCIKKLKGNNYPLVEELFIAKCIKLFKESFKDFDAASPNIEHLRKWFDQYCSRKDFLDRLMGK